MKTLILSILYLLELSNSFAFTSPNDSTGRVGDKFDIDVNNFRLPFNNSGVNAYLIYQQPPLGGTLNGDIVLFSGGFYLAGKFEGDIWTSSVASAALMEDYLPGVIYDSLNPLGKEIYVVRKIDQAFSKSWHDWKDAVRFGAKFYDGDLDGIYNPIDKNYDEIWNINEDMPFLLGDITAWCVYNDSKKTFRRLESSPAGIEIQQTIFASNEVHLQNTIFFIYSIINRGLISDKLDSTYFSIWADPDIGDHTNDLVGCDTSIFSAYSFDNGTDRLNGQNSPAIFLTLLQGPKVLDTAQGGFEFNAINNFGYYYGIYSYEGYKNLAPTSFQNYFPVGYGLHQEENIFTFFNRMQGLKPLGGYLDPCSYNAGLVIPDTMCDKVNPLYMFSGDPVKGEGWLDTTATDQRIRYNVGPFTLLKDEPQHIIVAYTAAKGVDALNSITVGKELVRGAIQEYKNNFPSLTYQPGEPLFPVTDYNLYQNYPNPFNPKTTIRFELPEDGVVSIVIFNALGQKIKTILNEYKEADRYEINFDASSLSSGIYFYELRAGSFSSVKKMVLLR